MQTTHDLLTEYRRTARLAIWADRLLVASFTLLVVAVLVAMR